MKKWLFLSIACILFSQMVFTQNVGIGNSSPLEKLQVTGNILVQQMNVMTNAVPTATQILTMIHNIATSFQASDSTGILYDPGGIGNYSDNQNGFTTILGSSGMLGYEILIQEMNLGTGDSLLILEGCSGNYLLRAGNGTSTGTLYIPRGCNLYLTFTSNGDGSNGTGFKLLFRKIYPSVSPSFKGALGKSFYFDANKGSVRAGLGLYFDTAGLYSTGFGYNMLAQGDYSSSFGNSLVYSPYSTAFGKSTVGNSVNALQSQYSIAGGQSIATSDHSTAFGESNVSAHHATALGGSSATAPYGIAAGLNSLAGGTYSVAMGISDTASFGSVAMGYQSAATGSYSVALGDNAKARSIDSYAMGYSVTANGSGAIALGQYTSVMADNGVGIGYFNAVTNKDAFAIGTGSQATGFRSMAIGRNNIASGESSFAIGNNASTGGQIGSFCISGNLTIEPGHVTNTTFQQMMMDFPGGYIFWSGSSGQGVRLDAGQSSWSVASDYRMKENFLPVSGEDVLHKIAAFDLTSWNYKKTDPLKYRHYGPMAQDFFNAFGKDAIGVIGNDTTINQQDLLGINLIAIQALEKRTQKIEALEQENKELKMQYQLLMAAFERLNQKMEALIPSGK